MTGDYVVFLDSDDALHAEYVRHLIEAQKETDTDIVICKSISFTNENAITSIRQASEFSTSIITLNRIDSLHALIHGDISVVVWNKLYKSYLWNNIRFPEGHVYEDMAIVV